MVEHPEFFQIFYPDADILLASGDFQELVRVSAGVEQPVRGQDELELRGCRYRLSWLDTLVGAFCRQRDPEPDAACSLFVLRPELVGNRAEALVVFGHFELCALPLSALRLPPPGLRSSLGRHGLLALHFAPAARIQYVVGLYGTGRQDSAEVNP